MQPHLVEDVHDVHDVHGVVDAGAQPGDSLDA
jgi:hypothetical protein